MNNCKKCGSEIDQYRLVCPVCHPEKSPQGSGCPACGHYCTCGIQFSPSPTDQRLDRFESAIRELAKVVQKEKENQLHKITGCENVHYVLEDYINKILGG